MPIYLIRQAIMYAAQEHIENWTTFKVSDKKTRLMKTLLQIEYSSYHIRASDDWARPTLHDILRTYFLLPITY